MTGFIVHPRSELAVLRISQRARATLKLPVDATAEDIKAKFRYLAKCAHPDSPSSAKVPHSISDLRDAKDFLLEIMEKNDGK